MSEAIIKIQPTGRRPISIGLRRPISIGFNDLAEADLLFKDAKRLHRFLTRAIAFLESKVE